MANATWPNWVDLIVLLVVLRTCYSGYDRGFLTELLHVVGVVCVTVLDINYGPAAAQWVQRWIPVRPSVVAVTVFWLLFLIGILIKQVLIRQITNVIRWERLHWAIQSLGLLLGGMRGLWWTGVILVAFASSGMPYLQRSVEQRSVIGPTVLPIARGALVSIADQCPGAGQRAPELFPSLREAPRASKTKR